MQKRLISLILATILSGCSLTPELVKPAAPIPLSYPSESSGRTGAVGADLGWRTMFPDPVLQHLIGIALQNNRDLRLALLNVEAVKAEFGIQQAARFPALEANAVGNRQRVAADPKADPPTASSVQRQVGLNVGLSAFEIDIFGRVRSMSDAAFARYLASDHGRSAAQIALVSAVAEAYLAERLTFEQQTLSEQTLEDWRQSLKLAQRLKDAKQSSGLEVAQAEGQVASAEAELEARIRARRQACNALSRLVGIDMSAHIGNGLSLEAQPAMTQLPAGVPSDLLFRRPDILQAEQNLVAANADIGAARAAFFPRISLTASLGRASSSMSGLFDSGHRVWNFAPQITVPLFQAGRLKSELRLAEIRKSAAVAEYEKAIQAAFQEVADGLAGQETYGRQIEAQTRTVQSATRRANLSALRYRAGMDGRLELLDSQRQLYAARQALLDLRRNELANAVALYKALGGGLTDTDADQFR